MKEIILLYCYYIFSFQVYPQILLNLSSFILHLKHIGRFLIKAELNSTIFFFKGPLGAVCHNVLDCTAYRYIMENVYVKQSPLALLTLLAGHGWSHIHPLPSFLSRFSLFSQLNGRVAMHAHGSHIIMTQRRYLECFWLKNHWIPFTGNSRGSHSPSIATFAAIFCVVSI